MDIIIFASILFLFVVLLAIIYLNGNKRFTMILISTFVFVLVIYAICSRMYSEYDYEDFTLKYSYVKNNNLYNLSIDEKEKYIEYVKFVNSEIDYAIKNWNSPCFGIYTDKRLLSYEKIEL